MKKVLFGYNDKSGSNFYLRMIRCICGCNTVQFHHQTNSGPATFKCKNCKKMIYIRHYDKEGKIDILIEKNQYRILSIDQSKLFEEMEKLVV